jgi:hypothetical protein
LLNNCRNLFETAIEHLYAVNSSNLTSMQGSGVLKRPAEDDSNASDRESNVGGEKRLKLAIRSNNHSSLESDDE